MRDGGRRGVRRVQTAGLLDASPAARGGVSRNVFGPFFDDGAIRCGDCYAARFWRGALAGAAIAGLVLTLLSLAKGELAGVLAGIGIGVIGVAFSLWRAAAFDRDADV